MGGEAFYGAQRLNKFCVRIAQLKNDVIDIIRRFSINFIQSSSKNRLFHMDFRFDHNEIVLNSNYPDGCWAQEERTPLPLLLGKKFNIEIKCSTDRFVVY